MEVNSKMEDNEPSDSINASVYLYLKIISKDIAKQFKKHVGLHHVPENTIKLQSLKKFRKRKNKEAANTSNVDDNDDTINDSVQEKADEVPVVNGDSSSPSKTKKRKKKAKTTVVQENSTEKVESPTEEPTPAAADNDDDDEGIEDSVCSPAEGSAKKKRKQSIEPYRRVRAEEMEVDPRFANNSFEAKKNSHGSWGDKANKDLKFTQGKSFRHEKTKKKRGSYKGGAVDMGVNSIKFDSD